MLKRMSERRVMREEGDEVTGRERGLMRRIDGRREWWGEGQCKAMHEKKGLGEQ